MTGYKYQARGFDALTGEEKAEAVRKADAFDVFVHTVTAYLGIRSSLPPDLEVNTSYEPYCHSAVELPVLPGCPTVPGSPPSDGEESLLEILLHVIYTDGYHDGRADGSKTGRRASPRPNAALGDGLVGRLGLVDMPPEGIAR